MSLNPVALLDTEWATLTSLDGEPWANATRKGTAFYRVHYHGSNCPACEKPLTHDGHCPECGWHKASGAWALFIGGTLLQDPELVQTFSRALRRSNATSAMVVPAPEGLRIYPPAPEQSKPKAPPQGERTVH